MDQQSKKYAVKSVKKPRGRPFAPGNRANPNGRPRGSRCLALRALDEIGDENAKVVLQAVIKKAKRGDARSAEILLSRCWPVPRGRLVEVDLPSIIKPADVVRAIGAVVLAVSSGKLSCEEGAALASVINYQKQAMELIELEQRVAALEADETERDDEP